MPGGPRNNRSALCHTEDSEEAALERAAHVTSEAPARRPAWSPLHRHRWSTTQCGAAGMERRPLDGIALESTPGGGRRTASSIFLNGGRAPDSWRALQRTVGPAPAAGARLQPARRRKPQTAVPLSARARCRCATRPAPEKTRPAGQVFWNRFSLWGIGRSRPAKKRAPARSPPPAQRKAIPNLAHLEVRWVPDPPQKLPYYSTME